MWQWSLISIHRWQQISEAPASEHSHLGRGETHIDTHIQIIIQYHTHTLIQTHTSTEISQKHIHARHDKTDTRTHKYIHTCIFLILCTLTPTVSQILSIHTARNYIHTSIYIICWFTHTKQLCRCANTDTHHAQFKEHRMKKTKHSLQLQLTHTHTHFFVFISLSYSFFFWVVFFVFILLLPLAH